MRRAFTATVFVAILSALSLNVFAQSESRDKLLKEIEAKRAELSALEKKFLAPSPEELTTYAEFLRRPDTGLIRLLPREVYDKDDKLTVRGGGAYYSFVRLTHAYGYGSDVSLEQGYLKVGFAGADYGMLLKIGDVPLEEITAEHPSVRFLSSYNAVTDEPQARIEQRRFATGTKIDGVPYSDRLPVEVSTTYVLRSINYSDSDVLVAFRVVRKDADGSLIIAWQLLKKYPVPQLARNSGATN
jgi:hypothetical protein